MKRIILKIVFFILSVCPVLADQFYESKYYNIEYPSSLKNPEVMAKMLDDYFLYFDKTFHCMNENERNPFTVKLIDDESEYIKYITEKTNGQKPSDDVSLLKYSYKVKDELIYDISKTEKDENGNEIITPKPNLIHRLLMQYLDYYFANIPSWLSGGYSIYFEHSGWTFKDGIEELNSVNPYLDSAKKMHSEKDTKITINQMINEDLSKYPKDVVFPQAWLMLCFLKDTQDKEYSRFLWDSISNMKFTKDDESFLQYKDKYLSDETLEEDFDSYIASLKTVSENISDGIAFYEKKDYDSAVSIFEKVIQQSPNNDIPYYYLGLICYEKKEFSKSCEYYNKAYEKGSNKALINWALGMSSYKDKKFEDAKKYFLQAKKLDSAYEEKVDFLLSKIK